MTAATENKSGSDAEKKSRASFPKLIVLDLDNTVWTPELYQLRQLQRRNQFPVAGKDVTLMKGAAELLTKVRDGDYFPSSTKFAVASRTQSGEWANDLLDQFEIRDVVDYVEIFPGNKKRHFENLRRDSGIDYADMLFFDDARDGKYGNCVPVSEMGVLSVHCPTGLETASVWETALDRFEEWDKTPNTIVEWDGTVTNPQTMATNLQEGTIKTINYDKGYGFLTPIGGNKQKGRGRNDVFFHFSALPDGLSVEQGDKLKFTVEKDPRNGKFRAANIELADGSSSGGSGSGGGSTIPMRAFSMNMPFAALLANGYKTIESRNGTMFQNYPEGTQMLLHVGRRIYPDGNKHMEILRDDGLSDDEIQNLKSLPPNFGKGMLVAILTLGKTYETTTAERSTTDMQRSICAYGPDSGRRLTEIKKVEYLKRPIPMAAQGGVFKVDIDPRVLPDEWEFLSSEFTPPDAYQANSDSGSDEDSQYNIVYEITG